MGADLFGSFAESTCAALVVSASLLKVSVGNTLIDGETVLKGDINTLMYPLAASGLGILVCILTAFIGIYITKVNRIE
jgi:inorganic pyrophosphatase